jgi:hypothetical protein
MPACSKISPIYSGKKGSEKVGDPFGSKKEKNTLTLAVPQKNPSI